MNTDVMFSSKTDLWENYAGRFGGAAVAGQIRNKGQTLEEAELK